MNTRLWRGLAAPLRGLADGAEAVADRLRPRTPDPVPPRRVIVWTMDRLGDAVRAGGAFRMIKKGLPAARLTLVAAGRSAALFAADLAVDEVIAVADPFRPWDHWRALRRARRAEWDLGLLLELDRDWARLGQTLFRCLGVRSWAGVDFGAYRPAAGRFLPWPDSRTWQSQAAELAQAIGGVDDGLGPRLHVRDGERTAAAALLEASAGRGPYIAVHPGGDDSLAPRRWPLRHFARLLALLGRRKDYRIVLTGSPAERGLAAEANALASGAAADLSGRLDLRQLMAVLERCALFVSSDTGPLHIAHALGTPSVAVFGPSSPERVGAPGTCLPVRGGLPCSPCCWDKNLRDCARPARCECLLAVEPEQVLKAVETQLARGRP